MLKAKQMVATSSTSFAYYVSCKDHTILGQRHKFRSCPHKNEVLTVVALLLRLLAISSMLLIFCQTVATLFLIFFPSCFY